MSLHRGRVLARAALAACGLGVMVVSIAPPVSAGGFSFTAGDLVIERVGDGTTTLINSGNPIFLDEYTPAGALVGSVEMPTTTTAGGNVQMLESGTATYDGELTLSADGSHLIVAGYDAAPGGTSLTGSASASVPRVAGSVDANGNINSTTALTDFATIQNYRSATSSDGVTSFYVSGNNSTGNSGIATAGLGATTSTEVNADGTGGSGEVVIYNGALYAVSRTAGTGYTVATFTPSLPSGAATAVPLTGFPTVAKGSALPSPDSIFLAKLNPTGTANPDTIYVTDDSATPAGGTAGEIEKWSLVGSTWTETGFIAAPLARGLTGVVTTSPSSGLPVVTLYATSSGSGSITGTLYSATDSTGFDGTASGTATTVVASIPTNETFRGITMAPVALGSPPVLPEAPLVALLPATGGLALFGVAVRRRRRRQPATA